MCRDHLAARLASGEPEKHVANEAGVAACGTFLVKLAGTSLPDLRAVLDFANGWTPPA